jgi:hypothetical protein
MRIGGGLATASPTGDTSHSGPSFLPRGQLAVASVVALFTILFTGRYPRGLFDFNVGVLRWSWRVRFYSYSALATDHGRLPLLRARFHFVISRTGRDARGPLGGN